MSLVYVQGRVQSLDVDSAVYTLNNDTETATIRFDYALMAAGRDCTWPTSPNAYNFRSYMEEMAQFHDNVSRCQRIGVIGAGADGIEIVGDIKNRFRDKDVFLVHPDARFLPKPLSEEFQDVCRHSLERGGVTVMTIKRVAREKADKTLKFVDGEKLRTDRNYWCSTFRNNTDLFQDSLLEYVTERINVYVKEYLQLQVSGEPCIPKVFAIGDLVELPII